MPRLKKYQDRPGHYILTGINNKIVTFQLAPEGSRLLINAGIKPDEVFNRSLLIDLYKKGMVFTFGTGSTEIVEEFGPQQLELDFGNDKEPESSFPKCSECGAIDDLHVISIENEGEILASVLCPKCRKNKDRGVSIPLQITDLKFLRNLKNFVGITKTDNEYKKYLEILNRNFQASWDAIRNEKAQRQGGLGLKNNDELGL